MKYKIFKGEYDIETCEIDYRKPSVGRSLVMASMDKTVVEAKGEIEAFMQNKIHSIANVALVEHQDEFKQLEIPVDVCDRQTQKCDK